MPVGKRMIAGSGCGWGERSGRHDFDRLALLVVTEDVRDRLGDAFLAEHGSPTRHALHEHALRDEIVDRWVVQGVRPANRPKVRLRQYAAWAALQPDWPARLEALAPGLAALPSADDPVRGQGIAFWRREFAGATGAVAVGGGRLDHQVSDGFLPLLAARTGWEGFALWSEWPAGDLPAVLHGFGNLIGRQGGNLRPRTQSFVQGVLGWLIERERRSRL